MAKRLVQIGNSFGLIIERPILDLLKITPETDLDLSTDGERLIVEPVRPESPSKKRRPVVIPTPVFPVPRLPKRGPRYGFPKKQPW